MKIQFYDPFENDYYKYQEDAIHAVTSIFEGQEKCQTNFTVAPLKAWEEGTIFYKESGNSLGIGNRLKLLPEDIHKNVRNTQIKNGLQPSEKLEMQ